MIFSLVTSQFGFFGSINGIEFPSEFFQLFGNSLDKTGIFLEFFKRKFLFGFD